MIDVPYTFQCKEMLFVLGRMRPAPGQPDLGTVTEAAMQLATELARNVIVVDDQELLVELDEPVEAVAIARSLDLRVARCIAGPLAMELLRESGGPAQDTWQWLRTQLKLEHDLATGIVKLDVARTWLPDNIDVIPDGPGVLMWLIDGDSDLVKFVTGPSSIGRSSAADFPLVDLKVGRRHATIEPQGGTWTISDLGSNNGVFVDGRRIRSRSLVPGMSIEIGDARLVVLSVR